MHALAARGDVFKKFDEVFAHLRGAPLKRLVRLQGAHGEGVFFVPEPCQPLEPRVEIILVILGMRNKQTDRPALF